MMCRDPSHATAEVWCYFQQYYSYWLKNADLEAFALPLAINMEAICIFVFFFCHCIVPGILDYQRKKVSGGLIICVFMPQKTLGYIFARIIHTKTYVLICFHPVFFFSFFSHGSTDSR